MQKKTEKKRIVVRQEQVARTHVSGGPEESVCTEEEK